MDKSSGSASEDRDFDSGSALIDTDPSRLRLGPWRVCEVSCSPMSNGCTAQVPHGATPRRPATVCTLARMPDLG